MADKISARIIVEIMGRPAKHIKEGLNTLVVRMGSEKGIEIIEKQYHDPKKIEKSDLFTAFAEIEADFDNLESFFGIIFNYMPANVEVTYPEKLKLKSSDINALSNFVLSKLHHYDGIAKRIIGERDILVGHLEKATGKKIHELFPPRKKKEEEKPKS